MSRTCFNTYAEGSSSEEEDGEPSSGWRKCLGDASTMRSYCGCGKTLRRVAKLPGHALILKCSSSFDCVRCDEVILPGELHFICKECDDIKICKSCGPGVYIHHSFDYYDPDTKEADVLPLPTHVLHERKARQKSRRAATRGLSLSATSEEDERALKLAQQIIQNTKALVQDIVKTQDDTYDKDWEPEGLLSQLLGAQSHAQVCDAARLLIPAATRIFAQSPTLQDVKAPCKIFGDLHGQLRDLMLLWGQFGFPGTPECPSVVFNGDFVDRGKHQVEVLVVLFALKIAYPHNVFLNRGNHEDVQMNIKYGFQRAVFSSFGDEHGPDIFALLGNAFIMLPLASLVQEKIFVVHGGIGDGKWSIDALRKVQRPLRHSDLQQDSNKWLWNLLWSDPIEDDERTGSSSVFGVHSSPRGKLAVKFGWNVTQGFCAENGLDLVVRSHQAKKCGLGFDVMHSQSLIRVFSARDYEGHENDCAILSVTESSEIEGGNEGVLTVRPQVLSAMGR
mmetsp:Transcript_60079/g.173238  ORF Transcript_60079/g.173238 Transcript_60079/m.173238 type:complete len:505 (-) Transcript_60079:138-1652(-)